MCGRQGAQRQSVARTAACFCASQLVSGASVAAPTALHLRCKARLRGLIDAAPGPFRRIAVPVVIVAARGGCSAGAEAVASAAGIAVEG